MIKRKDHLDKAYLAVRGEINGRAALITTPGPEMETGVPLLVVDSTVDTFKNHESEVEYYQNGESLWNGGMGQWLSNTEIKFATDDFQKWDVVVLSTYKGHHYLLARLKPDSDLRKKVVRIMRRSVRKGNVWRG